MDTDSIQKIILYTSRRVAEVLSLFIMKNQSIAARVSEIRLRKNRALSLSCDSCNILIDKLGNITDSIKDSFFCDTADIDTCIALLCENSVHSHMNEIESGYISFSRGYRIGVCAGQVFGTGGSVFEVNSVCIRIPHTVYGCSKELLARTGICGILIFSPPNVGKTTLLRDIVRELSIVCKKRTVIIDTRGELEGGDFSESPLAEYISGEEKGKAVEIAVRSLSAQIIVSDEIGSLDEARAMLAFQNSGVPFIATAHADSFEALLKRPNVRLLYDNGVFDKYVLLKRNGSEFSFQFA